MQNKKNKDQSPDNLTPLSFARCAMVDHIDEPMEGRRG